MFKQIQWAAVFLGIASIAAALLYKLIVGGAATSATEIIVAICIVGTLLALSPNLDSLKELSLTKEGLRVQLQELQKKTAENEQAIVDLILLSMGDETYKTLTMLADSNGFGKYTKEHHMGLESELYHLRNLGYVKRNEKARSIYDIPESGTQLSDYIYVTKEGRDYIELREQHSRKR